MNVVTERLKFADLFPEEAGKLAQRLHIKKEEIPFIRKFYTSEKSETQPKERAVVSYISTSMKDRDGEQLLPDGVILDNYRKNPVVLWGHDYKSMPVGKNLWIKQDEKGLIAKTVFANNEKADEVFRAYTEDIGGTGPLLKAFSVGFVPVEWEDTEQKALENDKDLPRRIYKKWELLEYSTVPIPSCPEALTLAVEKNLIPKSMQKAMEKYIEVEDFQSDPPDEFVVEGFNAVKTLTPDELKEHYRKVAKDNAEIEIEDFNFTEGKTFTITSDFEAEKDAHVKEGLLVDGDGAVTKPETTENYHRIPVSDGHNDHKIRTITVSAKKGIKGLYCVDCKKIKTYLFDTSKWTMEEAQAWVNSHKGILERFEAKEARGAEVDLQEAVNDLIENGLEDVEYLAFDNEEKLAVDEDEEMEVGVAVEEAHEQELIETSKVYLREIVELKEMIVELKEGRVLSRKNRDLVKNCTEALLALLKADATGSREDEDKNNPEEEKEIEVVLDKGEYSADELRAIINETTKKTMQNIDLGKAIDLSIKKLQGKVE